MKAYQYGKSTATTMAWYIQYNVNVINSLGGGDMHTQLSGILRNQASAGLCACAWFKKLYKYNRLT